MSDKSDNCLFVMAGFVIEGEIASGMLIRLPIQADMMMTAKIDHIEYTRRPDGDVVCLCIKCQDPKELALWEALKIKDRTIEVIAADSIP